MAKEVVPASNRIQKKMNKMKQGRDMLLYYLKVEDTLYDYENIFLNKHIFQQSGWRKRLFICLGRKT